MNRWCSYGIRFDDVGELIFDYLTAQEYTLSVRLINVDELCQGACLESWRQVSDAASVDTWILLTHGKMIRWSETGIYNLLFGRPVKHW